MVVFHIELDLLKRSRLWQQANMLREDFLRYHGRSRQQHQWIVNKINTLRRRIVHKYLPQVSLIQIFNMYVRFKMIQKNTAIVGLMCFMLFKSSAIFCMNTVVIRSFYF